jgi:hypothetical protein
LESTHTHAAQGHADGEEKKKGSDVATAPTDIYTGPITLFRRKNPVLRRRNARLVGNLDPTQLVLPTGAVALGFPPEKDRRGVEDDEGDEEGEQRDLDENALIVFSNAGQDQRNRNAVLEVLIVFLLACDAVLVSLTFFFGPNSIAGPAANGKHDLGGYASYCSTMAVIVLGLLAVRSRDTRLLTAFIALFYVDGIFNIIRIYTILQFAHFAIMLAICYFAKDLKSGVEAFWFQPTV